MYAGARSLHEAHGKAAQARAVSGDFPSLAITHPFHQTHITAFLYPPFFHIVHLSLYSPILAILSDIIITTVYSM